MGGWHVERLLRPSLDRWVLLVLLALTVIGKLIWSSGGGPVAFAVNMAVGVVSGYALYGLGRLVVIGASRARSRPGPTV